MKIPAQFDNWIVFGLSAPLSRIHYFPGHAVHFDPLHRIPIEGWLDSVVIATLITIGYVMWSALGRWLLRRLAKSSISANGRMYMNAIFFLVIVVAIGLSWLPLDTATGRILIPFDADPPPE